MRIVSKLQLRLLTYFPLRRQAGRRDILPFRLVPVNYDWSLVVWGILFSRRHFTGFYIAFTFVLNENALCSILSGRFRDPISLVRSSRNDSDRDNQHADFR